MGSEPRTTNVASNSNELSFQNDNKKGKRVASLVCWILGCGSLFCWNSMLTIGDYYTHLFPKYHPMRVLTLVYQPFSITTLAILAYNGEYISTRTRVLTGYILFFISSSFLIILDLLTSGKGGLGAFLGICLVSGIFGAAGAHTEGGVLGEMSFMCAEFIQSFSAGMGAAGVLTSALRIVTRAAFEDARNGLRKGALMFFGISAFFQLLCILLYAFVLPRIPIVQYFRSKAASEGSKTVLADLAAGGATNELEFEDNEDPKRPILNNRQLFAEIMAYGVNMFLIYAQTLSIFPGFLSEDLRSRRLGSWYPLVLIAIFNAAEFLGRYVPLVECIKVTSRKILTSLVLLRFMFVPAFYFAAKYGHEPTMISLTSLLGLTNGYLTVCIFIAAPKGYKGPEQNAVGNLLVLCLLVGIAAGVMFDWLWLIGKGL